MLPHVACTPRWLLSRHGTRPHGNGFMRRFAKSPTAGFPPTARWPGRWLGKYPNVPPRAWDMPWLALRPSPMCLRTGLSTRGEKSVGVGERTLSASAGVYWKRGSTSTSKAALISSVTDTSQPPAMPAMSTVFHPTVIASVTDTSQPPAAMPTGHHLRPKHLLRNSQAPLAGGAGIPLPAQSPQDRRLLCNGQIPLAIWSRRPVRPCFRRSNPPTLAAVLPPDPQ